MSLTNTRRLSMSRSMRAFSMSESICGSDWSYRGEVNRRAVHELRGHVLGQHVLFDGTPRGLWAQRVLYFF